MSDAVFGVDLITFFDPGYWGLDDLGAVADYAAREPASYWSRILDALVAAGVTQLEITFEPAGYRSAARAFGSAAGFGAELRRRGLALASGYFGDIEHAADVSVPDVRERILAEAARYAAFIAEAGGRYLVAGLPMRRNATAGTGYEPVGLRTAEPVAELVNEVGARTARYGIRTLLHTESSSLLWNGRDVDLMMLLTDALYVGLCLDTGHVTLAGSDPVAIARRHLDRLGLLHWKDAAGPFPGMPRIDDGIFGRHREFFRPVGEGIVDWRALAAVLKQGGFRECVLLELDAAAAPEAALTAARTYLESALGEALPPFEPARPYQPASDPQE
jgi:inosose dehydratase